jgi:hypothetical protein
MKKIIIVISVMVSILLLSSCSINKLEINDRIVAPENNIPPLQGKWIIERFVDSPYKDRKAGNTQDLTGKEALFHKEAIIVHDQHILEPSYKTRSVNISDYLLYKFKTEADYLGINEKDADIITVLGNDQYFYEFIKYNDDNMIIFLEDRFYFLRKIIDEISKEEIDRYISVEKNNLKTSSFSQIESLNSGVLLGIKKYNYNELDQVEEWNYETIWIKSNDKSITSSYKVENLLVPRKKGFWLIDMVRSNINGSLIDNIKATPKTKFEEEIKLARGFYEGNDGIKDKEKNEPPMLKNILYVGNDYISTEIIDKSTNRKTLQVYPIDYLEGGLPIMISDIVDSSDVKVFRDGALNILKSDPDLLLNEKSFGLMRRNGYWIMKGRINYQLEERELYKDYNIKTIPPKELVNYDELSIPWSKIKAKVPNATDAFTSPNKDIIIIETRNNLSIYSIHENEISNNELGKIKKDSSETIIMAEWSSGRYTNLWEEEVLKNSPETIKYK